MKNLVKLTLVLLLVASTLWFAPNGSPNKVSAHDSWVGAAESIYYGGAGTQPMDINVSNSTAFSSQPEIAFDSSGYPHIVWEDTSYGNREILYVHWNGTNWQCVNGDDYSVTPASANVSNNTESSFHPSLALDSNDNPHIAWHDDVLGNYEIMYVRWDGVNWVCADGSVYNGAINPNPANVSNNAETSSYSQIALDSSDNPHIAWHEFRNGSHEIMYVRWDGVNWVCADGSVYNGTANPNPANVSNNSGNSSHPQITLDPAGNPHIVWQDESYGNPEILYVHWNGTNWVCADGSVYNGATNLNPANVSNNTESSFHPSLALDSNDNPHIAWHDYILGNYEIMYVRWNGVNWVRADGYIYNGSFNPYPANVSNNTENSNYPQIALDSSDSPHIAWRDGSGSYEIMYVTWDGVNWVCADGSVYNGATNPNPANVSNNDGNSRLPQIALDLSDNPHIVWEDASYGNREIMYVRWLTNFDFKGQFSLTKSVDTNNDGGYGDNHTAIQNGDMLSYQINLDKISGIDPIIDGYVYDSIPLGTEYIAGSAMPLPLLEYSYDLGATWVPGEPPDGAPGGTMLRWSVADILPATSGNLANAFFSVNVVDANIMGVNNAAFFVHRDNDTTGFLSSNIISNTTVTCAQCPDCPECPECPDDPTNPQPNSANLEVTKTAGSMHYYKNDLFTFKAKVGNTGNLEASNVTLTDNFPREMEMVASRPKGIISNGKWTYNVGELSPGEGRIFDFIFRLKNGTYLSGQPLSLTNIITATADDTDKATDNASIVIREKTATKQLSLDVAWTGINTKTSSGKAGDLITLTLTPDGGSSPYEIMVDWGDGEKSFVSEISDSREMSHKYISSGEYKVIIKLTDKYGKTLFVERVLSIE